MLRSRLTQVFVVCALIASTATVAAAAPDSGPRDNRRNYIVVFEDWVGDPAAASEEHRRAYGAQRTHVYTTALKGYAARMSERAATQIAQRPNVAWVELDREVAATAQLLPTGINRAEADLSPTARIDGVDDRVNVDVAVLDTGIDLRHPDLNVYSSGGKDCVTGIGSPNDLNGHGTHVAGTIGALDNGSGVVGVAPGARLWPVKVLTDTGIGLMSMVVCGIDYVASKASQIEVANMSLGGGGSDDGNCGYSNNDAQHKAICRAVGAGVTFAVAAGNDSEDAKNTTPAAYDEVITVSALADFNGVGGGGASPTCRKDEDDTFANYSNYGADIDLIAPGTCIYSTYTLGTYATLSGTSMASPHVAGGAALYKANNPGASPATVKSALQSAGTLDWIWPSQDKDGIQERLLNVSTL